MSVQLIVYPQNYQGFSNSATTSNDYIVDGIDFNTVNASVDTQVVNTGGWYTDLVMNYYSPIIAVNTWYRYYDVASGNVQKTGAFLNLISLAANPNNGIIQKLSNLTVGSVYDVEIDIQLMVGQASFAFYSNNVFQGSIGLTGAGVQNLQFTATATEMTILLVSRYISISNLLQLNSIKIIGAPFVPSGAVQLLEDGQVICDLYEDEDLPLTLSVDDFKNVAEKVQSYSKAFNLPSTKRNNRIFDHIFEITREVASAGGLLFNPYKRTKCVLKQDGFILFEGYLRMLDITDKEGEISYSVNLYSEVIALSDTLKDRTFIDLDFTELEHPYNYSEIRNSWQGILNYTNAGTSGFRSGGTVRYPFVDWNHQFILGASGNPVLPTLETAFRPFISIKYLIDRIFEATDFTYSSDFFDTADFGKLYMDFNWGGDDLSSLYSDSGTGYLSSYQDATQSYATVLTNNNTFPSNAGYSAGVFSPIYNGTTYNIDYSHYIRNYTALSTLRIRWVLVQGGITSYIDQVNQFLGIGDNFIYSGSFNETLNIGDTLYLEFLTTNSSTVTRVEAGTSSIYETIVVVSGIAISNNTLSQTLRGELGQWDFLKGLITMFNLVTLVDEDNPNNIIIEPYSDVFIPTATGGTTLANRGIQHDWTDKIDVSEMKLTPLTDLNKKTIFKFAEDEDDYAFNQYKSLVGGHLYGSYLSDAGNEFNLLDGEDEIIVEPFAATLVKPLMSQYPEFITPSIYANGGDGVWEGFENSPRIMYKNGVVDMTSTTYSVPAQNGVAGDAFEDQFLQFSHLSDVPTASNSLDFHFGECQLMPGVGSPVVQNLYGLYWEGYFNELYNPNTRTMTIKVNLSPSDINRFRFNDRVFIKNRVFRVNKIDYKPNDLATVEFILIP